MKENQILYTDGSRWLYTQDHLSCDTCTRSKLHSGFYLEAYDRKRPATRVFLCKRCYEEGAGTPKGYDVCNDHILVLGYVPERARVWVPRPPTLVASKAEDSVFSASRQTADEETIDRTRAAGRPEYSLAGDEAIGIPEALVRTPDDDADGHLLLSAAPDVPALLEEK